MSPSDSPISPATSLKEGYILNNSYVIERKIGMGGFGITYKATEIASGRTVVIKENFPLGCVYRDGFDGETVHPYPDKVKLFEWSLDNFKKEAGTLIDLPYHPNVVRVLAAFYANNTGYIVMKQVKGISLHKLYPEHSNVPRKFLKPFMNSMLDALSHLHKHGVIHRDIKPENIIISPDDTPVLIDFGAARVPTKNRKASQIGTFGYAAPEQISKNCYDDVPRPHIDLYALGATCYRLITGREPIYNTDLLTANKIARRHYSRNVLATIDKARESEPLKRWQSAAEWQSKLNNSEKKVNPIVAALSLILTFSFVLFMGPILKKCDGTGQTKAQQTEVPNIKLPEPVVTPMETPAPAVEETPAPAVEETPEPAVEETPMPAVEETPAPAVEETPAPAVEEIPEPAVEETPEPAVEEIPMPAVEEIPILALAPEETPAPMETTTPEPSTLYEPPVPELQIPTNTYGDCQPNGTSINPPSLPVTELLLNEDSKFYTVKRGDSLLRIARKHKISLTRLMQLNNMTNEGAIKIRIGDRLRVAE